MSIFYKFYPEEELFIEVMTGEITIDKLSAYFLELEHNMNFDDATYVYSDHRNAVFNFSDIHLKQLTNGFLELSKAYGFKKWALIYEDESHHMKQTIQVMSDFIKSKDAEFMKFFNSSQIKESFEFLETKKGEILINEFLMDLEKNN